MSVSATPVRRLVWAIPFSLAATYGIEVSLFSCSYLDVSVRYVRLCILCIQIQILRRVGCPIRKSLDQSLVASSLGLIAGSNVLHRLLTPSHPPHALSSLLTPTGDRRLNHQTITRHHNKLPCLTIIQFVDSEQCFPDICDLNGWTENQPKTTRTQTRDKLPQSSIDSVCFTSPNLAYLSKSTPSLSPINLAIYRESNVEGFPRSASSFVFDSQAKRHGFET